ncbi:hypothetical protein [Planobispora rosea]|uniref:hypothetical protein n=1 Tax=Planobispora rosea TaxID=35762 RepID=UPI00083AE54A|nr:hypothetical protein [Planobispora rosea]
MAGIHPLEALALAAWTVVTAFVRPARIARRMLAPPPAPEPAAAVAVVQEADAHPAAAWWATKAAVDGGSAPGTLLEDIERTGPAAMRAIIRCAVAGQPVPDISIRRLSALMDVPEDLISITPVPGRGAGVRRLTIGRPEEGDPAAMWARRIAPAAMPGAVLTGVRIGRPGTTPAPTLTITHEETDR